MASSTRSLSGVRGLSALDARGSEDASTLLRSPNGTVAHKRSRTQALHVADAIQRVMTDDRRSRSSSAGAGGGKPALPPATSDAQQISPDASVYGSDTVIVAHSSVRAVAAKQARGGKVPPDATAWQSCRIACAGALACMLMLAYAAALMSLAGSGGVLLPSLSVSTSPALGSSAAPEGSLRLPAAQGVQPVSTGDVGTTEDTVLYIPPRVEGARVFLAPAPHESATDAARVQRVYTHMRDCVRSSELQACAAGDELPHAPPDYDDLHAHYLHIMNVTAPYRDPSHVHTHVYGGYTGPWIENYWVDSFIHKPFSYWYPFVPLLVRWTDMCVGNDTDKSSWRRAYLRCEALGSLLGRQAPPKRGPSAPRVQPSTTILRDDVIYITVVQDSGGLRAAPDCWWIRNVLIFGAGGWGNVPIPLLKGDASTDTTPHTASLLRASASRPRKSVWSFAGKLHYNRTVMLHELSEAGYNDSDARYTRTYYGSDWKRVTLTSLLTLAPRAIGVTSFRMYEALQLGVIPVYVWWDRLWLPYHNASAPSLWLTHTHSHGSHTPVAAAAAMLGGRTPSSLRTHPPVGVSVHVSDLNAWARNMLCALITPGRWDDAAFTAHLDATHSHNGTVEDYHTHACVYDGVCDRGDAGGGGSSRRRLQVEAVAAPSRSMRMYIHALCSGDGRIHMPDLARAEPGVSEARQVSLIPNQGRRLTVAAATDSTDDLDATQVGERVSLHGDPVSLLHQVLHALVRTGRQLDDIFDAHARLTSGDDTMAEHSPMPSYAMLAAPPRRLQSAEERPRVRARVRPRAPPATPTATPSPDPAQEYGVHDDTLLAHMEQRAQRVRESHFSYAGVIQHMDAFIRDPKQSELVCVQRPVWRPPGSGFFAVRPKKG